MNCMGYSIHWWLWGYSIPWGGGGGGGGGVRYSLVNNVRGVRYSLGYRIHSDTGNTCCNLFQWLVTFRFVLKFTYLLQSVFISSSFSCQAFMLTGFHLFHWQVEQSVCSYLSPLQTFPCFCSSVSAGFARSLLLSAIWVSREAGFLSPFVFSLSTQLLALAYRDIR